MKFAVECALFKVFSIKQRPSQHVRKDAVISVFVKFSLKDQRIACIMEVNEKKIKPGWINI